jgi:hypothetical protein
VPPGGEAPLPSPQPGVGAGNDTDDLVYTADTAPLSASSVGDPVPLTFHFANYDYDALFSGPGGVLNAAALAAFKRDVSLAFLAGVSRSTSLSVTSANGTALQLSRVNVTSVRPGVSHLHIDGCMHARKAEHHSSGVWHCDSLSPQYTNTPFASTCGAYVQQLSLPCAHTPCACMPPSLSVIFCGAPLPTSNNHCRSARCAPHPSVFMHPSGSVIVDLDFIPPASASPAEVTALRSAVVAAPATFFSSPSFVASYGAPEVTGTTRSGEEQWWSGYATAVGVGVGVGVGGGLLVLAGVALLVRARRRRAAALDPSRGFDAIAQRPAA